MGQRKIQLEDLANMNDGTVIDVAEVAESTNPAYNLVVEEIEVFNDRPVERARAPKNTFSSYIPASDLKESIEAILKTKTTQEDRIKKHMQFEFDRKMQRINKIKSRAFRRLQRRAKLRQEQALDLGESSECSLSGSESASADESVEKNADENASESANADTYEAESSEMSDSASAEQTEAAPNPVLEFSKPAAAPQFVPDQQYEMVRDAFADADAAENESDFLREKRAIAEEEAPKVTETVLPGWDEWAGDGLEVKRTKYNTLVDRKDGIWAADRKDFGRSNVIINESVAVPDKYKSSLPYGYSAKEYKEWMKTPISAETNSARVFKKFMSTGTKSETTPGENIKPNEFVPDY
ncbi:hypothetical protein PAPHI01_1029 [Pancytospora philotis]|nr:hypothetical protein PAPHI01_1029 [Pancytospora philotis]